LKSDLITDFIQNELVPIEAHLKAKQVANGVISSLDGLMDEQTLSMLQEKNLE
jgi:hypothetical protein